MSIFKRAVLLIVGLLLVIASLPYVIHNDYYFWVSQPQMVFNVMVGSITAIYNFLIIYKRAKTIYYVTDSDKLQGKKKEEKGVDS